MTIASENDFICPPKIFLENKRFQGKNNINKIIAQAGHVPWLMALDQVQHCFDDFVIELNSATMNRTRP